MWRLTLAQMRRTAGRLIAVGIAIALGTAFITATFLATGTIQQTAYAAARAGVGDPDLVLTTSEELTPELLVRLEALDGVAAVQPLGFTYREVRTADGSELLTFTSPATDPRLEQVHLLDGVVPTSSGQVVLPAGTAERLGVGIGDTVTSVSAWAEGERREGDELLVTGIAADGSGLGFGMPLGLVTTPDVTTWRTDDGWGGWSGATFALTDAGRTEDVSSAVGSLVPDGELQTGEQYAAEVAASFTGGVSVFRGLILGFAAVAMVVAGLVIANTFTVLVAQRTRTLALLRCVGATRAQIRSSVRREALLLGVTASLVGIATGIGLGQLVLSILSGSNDGVPLPAVVPVDGWTVLVPLVVGTVVTLVAAGGAARAATRVAPLAALRPLGTDAPDPRSPGSRRRSPRAAAGWLLVALGTVTMAAALVWSSSDPANAYMPALGLGILGGLLSMVGVVLAAITIVPTIVRVLGREIGSLGSMPARLAATNSVRNPARTTSTATALIVGVTLVTMMATGAATARTQLDGMLTDEFAIDVAVTSSPGHELGSATIEAVRAVDGVTGSALMDVATAQVTTELGTTTASVHHVARIPELFAVLHSAPTGWERGASYADGYLLSQDGPLVIAELEMRGKLLNGLPDFSVLVDDWQWGTTGLTADSQTLWLSLAPDADPRDVVAAVTDAVSSTSGADRGATPMVTGSAVERAGYAQIIDTLLVVVIGLLAVAVVIALLGVANTLSLSVVERRQENALLRALGLTRRQLRVSLAVEGVLLALVGALVGIVLGLGYGWIGSTLLLGVVSGGVPLLVPWSAIGLVVLVAVVAGVLASVLPARSAVRVPPVVALAS